MENVRRKVFLLTFICVLLYFSVSVVFEVFRVNQEPFSRINLISDIIKKQDKKNIANRPLAIKKNTSATSEAHEQDFNLYKKPNFITNFNAENQSSLPKLMEKLQRLKNGEKIKIRIAYLGDSMIEGDLISQTFRKLLQKEYGGSGVGFVPLFSNVSNFRQTAKITSKGWTDSNFMDKKAKNLYISGYQFTGAGSGSYTDNTIENNTIKIEKSLIYAGGNAPKIFVNDVATPLTGSKMVNRQVVANDTTHSIKIAGQGITKPIYGLSFESETGVFVDNFSFRGITGVELKKLSADFMQSIQEANPYDLIILQYGVNLLFRANDTDYPYYYKTFEPVLKQIKTSFKDSEILLIGSADRAFRYNGENKTAIGLPNLIENQALMAFQNNLTFYNQFETMGGENSIVKWAEQQPPMANKDYIHPNQKGAEFLGQKLFEAIQKDYQKYQKK